jgi:cytochrome oxidase Cu insertion factor (SCO1/SenC/PrrC family)
MLRDALRSIPAVSLLIATLLALGFAPRLAAWFQDGRFYGLAVSQPLPEVELLTADREPLRLSDFRGRPFFVYFGYLRCRTVCPLSLATLRGIIEASAARNIPVLYINLNPAEHAPATLREYARHFGDRMRFAYGSGPQLVRAARAFHANFYVPEASGAAAGKFDGASGLRDAIAPREIEHSDAIYLVDAQTNLRGIYLSSRRDVARMLADVRLLDGAR